MEAYFVKIHDLWFDGRYRLLKGMWRPRIAIIPVVPGPFRFFEVMPPELHTPMGT
jgi:hypothetical protein